jgi:hypothetical protein
MLAHGSLLLSMLALEPLVPPSHQLALGVVGVWRHHLAVVDVVAAQLLMSASGLLVLLVLALDLLALPCRQLVLGTVQGDIIWLLLLCWLLLC